VPVTEFKLKLKEGCEELEIPFDNISIKEDSFDVIVNYLLQKFDSFVDPLNKILRK